MKVIILGSGTSSGVPVIGCHCPVCLSLDSRNRRTRASLAIQSGTQTLLIDTSPEMRLQVLAAKIDTIEAVLYTHIHADHSQGFDDLRAFYFKSKRSIDCFLMQEFHADFKQRFRYAFEDTGYLGAKPQIQLKAMPNQLFKLGPWDIEPVRLPHGNITTCGFRFGNFAYATDFKGFPEEIKQRWKGKIDTMVASGIHYGQHPSHSVIPETLELFQQLEVRRGIISHLAHDIDYVINSKNLPSHVEFAFDGMTIDL